MTSAEELSGHPSEAHSAAAVEMVRLPPAASGSNYVPSRIERWLQSVVLDRHGRMLLTASNLTGRFWDAIQCSPEIRVSD